MQEALIQSLGLEYPLEEEFATYSNILPQEILWTEEPGGLQSTGSQRGRQSLVTKQQSSLVLPSLHVNFFFSPQKMLWSIYLWQTVARRYSQTFFGVHIYLFVFGGEVIVAKWVFSSCSEQGLLFVAVSGLLIAVNSLIAEHGLCGVTISVVVVPGL